ncbi:porin family protein, partial [Mesorhizobium sp. M4B.F.Ca.ET.200.01.1.1]
MRRLTLASAGFLALLSGCAWAADMGADLPMTEPGFD